MAGKKHQPTREEKLSKAGKDLQNPHTRETRESEAARELAREAQRRKKQK
jgi:hypothetical protein